MPPAGCTLGTLAFSGFTVDDFPSATAQIAPATVTLTLYRCGGGGMPSLVEADAPSADELHALLQMLTTRL